MSDDVHKVTRQKFDKEEDLSLTAYRYITSVFYYYILITLCHVYINNISASEFPNLIPTLPYTFTCKFTVNTGPVNVNKA